MSITMHTTDEAMHLHRPPTVDVLSAPTSEVLHNAMAHMSYLAAATVHLEEVPADVFLMRYHPFVRVFSIFITAC